MAQCWAVPVDAPSLKYFAAAPPEEIGNKLVERFAQLANADGINTGVAARGEKFAQAYRHYWGFESGLGSTNSIERGGSQGELSRIRINKSRAVAKSLLGLILGPKFTWRPQARNGDANARNAVQLASNLLEFKWKSERMERLVAQWVEAVIVFSETFVFAPWDEGLGPPLAPTEDGQGVVSEGDVALHLVFPWDTIRDPDRRTYESGDWIALRLWENKFDKAAMFPVDILGEPAVEKILAASQAQQVRAQFNRAPLPATSDTAPFWYFFHRKTSALPQGRQVILTGGGCVLRDKPLDGDAPPLVRLAADELFDTPFAYTSWWDCLGIQELMDGLETAIASNQLTLGAQSIAMEEGTEASPDSAHGLTTFYYPRGGQAPRPLQLTASPPEIFKHLEAKASDQRDLVGLNDVVQGNPQTAQMNAEAFSILASMAVQRNSPFQQAVVTAVGRLGSLILSTLKRHVDQPRKIAIAGVDATLFAEEEWTGEKLAPIETVFVEIGEPNEQSVAGRYQMAQMLMQAPPEMRDQLQQVLETGRLEPSTQGGARKLKALEAENQQLAQGKPCQVHVYEDHLLHFKENAAVLMLPGSKENAQVVTTVQQHCDEHYREYWGIPNDPATGQGAPVQQDPQYPVRLRIMLGQQPPPMAPDAGAGGPPPPGGASAGPPQGMPGAAPEAPPQPNSPVSQSPVPPPQA